MHVLKNVKSTKKWNTASCALKHAEDVLKNAAKWLDKHTTTPSKLSAYDRVKHITLLHASKMKYLFEES